ncbi:alpha-galactosidase [Caproicibacter fermentans]|uniref:Alpha-galactosidase n=1 Tax=Caproicibacter fermentans TaxID=2576756 RepID=A0A7G8T640_9FIRM|nr:alpha-galactosidase [Caproicibacter fermentans]QNK39081.1 alpha-galactosidase [Caproicibacter fermentans]
MPILFEPQNKVFHLYNRHQSYILQIVKDKYPAHIYWGKRVGTYNGCGSLLFLERGFSPNPYPYDRNFSLDWLPQEYPSYGNGDFRSPAVTVQREDGSVLSELYYRSYQITNGKPRLLGLPATYAADDEAQTLELVLYDRVTCLQLELYYTIFNNCDVITRWAVLKNRGTERLKLLRILSANVDFRDDAFDMLTLSGGYINERNVVKRPVLQGTQLVESCRGVSSPQENPFFALMRRDATEDYGEVYGFNLVYSGNFTASVQADQFHTARAAIGVNPFDFCWLLEPGGEFTAPEAVMVFSSNGLGGMSRTYHDVYRSNLCRGEYRDKERPLLLNGWEAFGFNFDENKILTYAEKASEIGFEMLVLDDGWFGKRTNDTCSLGDWECNSEKIPNGLSALSQTIKQKGLKFGLWFEPEAISEDSKLYRAHPDWCLHVGQRPYTEGRNQLVLDLSRTDVCRYIVGSVSSVLSASGIGYVKWDMNRHLTEIGSPLLPAERQRETAHRYVLGLYSVLEELTSRFPHVLFESCSGGGGRFDPGMLYYMPQTWTSDNTDAACRLSIQYGTSVVYPPVSMCCHVSDCPNWQTGRETPLATRGYVAMSGNMGYELDITKLSGKDTEEIKNQIKIYKEIRNTVQFGDFYRLLSPFEGEETAWIFVSKNQEKAVAYDFRTLAKPFAPITLLKLKGLNPGFRYKESETGEIFGGDELMNIGIAIAPESGDFTSRMWRLEKIG